MRVLVIWEPMLATDWARPGSGVLSRIPDRRALQFWDKGHLFAQQLRRDLQASAGPPGSDASGAEFCNQLLERDGTLWDLLAVYPKGARWGDALPQPALMGCPAVRMTRQLEKSVATKPEPPASSVPSAVRCGDLGPFACAQGG